MNFEDDCDDSPTMTATYLKDPNQPYQLVLNAFQNELHIDTETIYKAVIDLITSRDPNRAEAIDYLLEFGIPHVYKDKEPIIITAARQPKDAYNFDVLLIMCKMGFSLNDENEKGESAAAILSKSNPELLRAIQKYMQDHQT